MWPHIVEYCLEEGVDPVSFRTTEYTIHKMAESLREREKEIERERKRERERERERERARKRER